MSWTRWLRFFWLGRSPVVEQSPCALSVADFRHTLALEESRRHRTGLPFAVLSFRLRSSENDQQTWGPLIRVLQQRLRSLDRIGWLEAERLGAVLPATSPSAAEKVAESLRLHFATDSIPEIYVEVVVQGSTPEVAIAPDDHEVLAEVQDLRDSLAPLITPQSNPQVPSAHSVEEAVHDVS